MKPSGATNISARPKGRGDDKEWRARHDGGEGTATKQLENAEAEVNRARGEAFEYGCDAAAISSPKAITAVQVAAISGSVSPSS